MFLRESKKIWRVAGPITLNGFFSYALNSSVQIFAGHLSAVELSAVSTSFLVTTNFPTIVLIGLGSAMDTLCGQAFGAGKIEMLAVYLQLALIILLVAALLMSPVYIFATPILKFLGQDEKIAVLAGKFSMRIIPQIFAMAMSFPVQKFLQAQSKVSILTCIAFGGLVLHISLLGMFVYVFDWGLDGAAAAYNLSSWAVSIAQLVYIIVWHKFKWTRISFSSTIKEVWSFLKLSLASAMMFCMDGWNMMVMMVITGLLNNPAIALGSISICMNINTWISMLFFGIDAAASVRVSNELGSGNARAAKYSIAVIGVTALAIAFPCIIVILATRTYFPVLFASSKELQKAVAEMAYLLILAVFLSSIQPVIIGASVGGGWQGIVAYINFLCYYLIGIPLQYIFGFLLHWNALGTWGGMLCGLVLQKLILSAIVWKTNWKDEAKKASNRMQLWVKHDETIDSQI
ncbi:protein DETOXIFICATION 34-like [Dioscorea cayenensis subsp. rotundata]|uniref:Protein DETOXIFICATION n=1 Tax=Dioscorea cayennensis subsp. rotundata TaxID=55577 RepID=A0AB40B4F0_DIOCR|nr:protein DETOXIFICATION 34-like [Dioscorea cayenensis subsp. rotundata]